MHAAYPRLFEPAVIDGAANARHLDKAAYVALARAAATLVAAANGSPGAEVTFPDGERFAPVRVRVRVRRRVELAVHGTSPGRLAEAELAPAGAGGFAHGGGYDGPLALRQRTPMRRDVALAFDRLEAAARADGVALIINMRRAPTISANAGRGSDRARDHYERERHRAPAPPWRSERRRCPAQTIGLVDDEASRSRSEHTCFATRERRERIGRAPISSAPRLVDHDDDAVVADGA